MTLQEQLDLFDRKAEQAYRRSLTRLRSPAYKARVLARARERLIQGQATYGDLMFGWPHDRLCDEELQEHADGMVNYPLARIKQGWPT